MQWPSKDKMKQIIWNKMQYPSKIKDMLFYSYRLYHLIWNSPTVDNSISWIIHLSTIFEFQTSITSNY